MRSMPCTPTVHSRRDAARRTGPGRRPTRPRRGGCLVEAGQFSTSFVEAGLQASDLAEPAAELSFLDAVAGVVDDLDRPWSG